MRRTAAVVLLPLFLLPAACRDAATTTGPAGAVRAAPAPAPSFDFTNAPEDLPNVTRSEGLFFFSIQDPQTDLIAWAGLPADPTTTGTCFRQGFTGITTANFQDVGALQEVVRTVATAGDINIHVYDRSDFLAIVPPPGIPRYCVATLMAQGTGRLSYIDNDAILAGEGANSWGYRIRGLVTFKPAFGGGTALLLAHNRLLIEPDGTGDDIVILNRSVTLVPR